MASPEVLDFPRLLAPIPGSNPAGKDLRKDFSPKAIRGEIKDARDKASRAERALLYKGGVDDHGDPVPPPDWRPVLQLAPKALAEQSKDLELVALLTEALARKHGFAGLRDGFRLARELAEKFWDSLYPTPDEDGVRTRIHPLVNLNGEEGQGLLVEPIRRIPVSAEGGLGKVDVAHYRNLLEDINQSWEEFEKLGQVLEGLCNKDGGGEPVVFPTSAIRKELDACRHTVAKMAGPIPGSGAKGGPPALDEGGKPMASGSAAAEGAVGTREQAFDTLLRVAEFFKRTEPHSPISYALEQAVRWGKMPLPQLLDELIPEEPVRQQLFKLIGIAAEPPKGQQ